MRLSTWLGVVLALLLVGLVTPTVKGDVGTDQQTATGTIKSVDAKQHQFVLTIKDQDQAFQLSDNAKVRRGDKDAKLADLKAGDKVTVTFRMEARAIWSAQGMHARGKIESVSATKNQLVLKDAQGKEHTFTLDKNSKVRLADKDGAIADLKAGDEVFIGYQKNGDQMQARFVRTHRANEATRIARGEVKSVASEKNRLVLKDARGTERTFDLARDAKVRLNEKDSKLADLKAGEQVNVTYARMVTDLRSAQ